MPFVKEWRNAEPPWETAPYGMVSLLTMLEFAAVQYVDLAHQLGLFLAKVGKTTGLWDRKTFNTSMNKLLEDANDLGLVVTRDHIGRMLVELVGADPSKASLTTEGYLQIKDASLSNDRLLHHLETVYSTMRSELGAILFKAIPRERAKYSNSEWLKGSIIESKFPTSFKELVRGGSCYSVGQPTSSVFHAMRALEPALTVLAQPFGISTAHENWQNIIEQIEGAVRALGQQSKSQQKIDDEKFFGAAVSHLYFVKNAWRNHIAHARDSYSDDEALKILSHTLEFIESLYPRLQE